MLVDSGGDELQFYPQVIIQLAEQSSSDDLRLMDDVVSTEHPVKLTFKKVHADTSLQDGPDIQRCGQSEDETSEQDRRRGELKLTVLAVIEVCRAELHEEENRQDHIHHRKDHVVDHRLHLSLGGVPCLLDSSG